MPEITVFKAKTIITMDPNLPEATHVAVQDGKILAVGDENCADAWGNVTRSDELNDAILMPGFVEGHAHLAAGAIWNYAYAGYHDRIDPAGKLWKGMRNVEDVIAGLSEFEKNLDGEEALFGWGFDPIFLTSERLNRHHLDKISTTRPIAILFSNFHLMCVNTKALEMAGYSRETNAEGVIKDKNGEPTGELQEMAAMFPVMRRLNLGLSSLSRGEKSVQVYGQVGMRAGVTTSTDLFSSMEDGELEVLKEVTKQDDFPLRLVSVISAIGASPADIAKKAQDLAKHSSAKLRLGAVKLMTDGSIQGWTARVKWPGYIGGQPNGMWNTSPDEIYALCDAMQEAGIQMHIHVNGDEAADVSLDALEAAYRKHPWNNHRHVLQHCQMMGVDQFRRCADMGVCANIFSNHIWYFGDQHVELTIGEDRARRMDAVRSALDEGVHVALHSDAPVTSMAPLFTAWCAVNRVTMSGRVLGENQRICVEEALYAITLGAAYTLKMDHEIGSIETGKYADFVILGDNPLAVPPQNLKDIAVLGTVLGGRIFRA